MRHVPTLLTAAALLVAGCGDDSGDGEVTVVRPSTADYVAKARAVVSDTRAATAAIAAPGAEADPVALQEAAGALSGAAVRLEPIAPPESLARAQSDLVAAHREYATALGSAAAAAQVGEDPQTVATDLASASTAYRADVATWEAAVRREQR